MTRVCPSCGATDYGTPFCVSCQKPLDRSLAAISGTAEVLISQQGPVVKAGFFRRFAALALDWLTLSVIADIVRFSYKLGSGSEPGIFQINYALGLSAVLFLLYFTLLTGEGGQTLGKMLLGIRVRRVDGSPVGYGGALLRTLGYLVSIFFGSFLGFLWALWDKNNQTWHDKIAGTIVVKI